MPVPETWWVDLLIKAGTPVLAVITTLRVMVARKAVTDQQVTTTIETVKTLEPRVRELEDAKIRMGEKITTIDERTKGIDSKLDANTNATQQILGELRAGRR